MDWARAALVGGLLVIVAAFAVGTEHTTSTVVMGRTLDCGPAISASWLVSGTPDRTTSPATATGDEKRVDAACGPVVRQSRVLVLTSLGVGGLLALLGWTPLRRRDDAVPDWMTPLRV
jgi:hypothetical protein